jgi:hypothetical protein
MVVTAEDMAMTRAAYAETPPGRKVVPMISTGPYAMQGVGVYESQDHIDGCGDSNPTRDIARCLLEEEPDVVLVYKSVEMQGEVLENRPPGWSRQVIDQLVATGEYRIRYQNGFNAVLLKATPTVVAGPQDGVPGG